jgi:hypothetical protein
VDLDGESAAAVSAELRQFERRLCDKHTNIIQQFEEVTWRARTCTCDAAQTVAATLVRWVARWN